MRQPHAVRKSESEIQSYGPLVQYATLAFIYIVGLLFTGFVIGTGIRIALAFWAHV